MLDRRAVRHLDGRARPARACAHPPVRAARPLRALLLGARLRSARPLQHRRARAHRSPADAELPRRAGRFHRAARRVAAGARAHDRATEAGRPAGVGRRRTRGAHRPHRAQLAGRPARDTRRPPRRGTRAQAGQPLWPCAAGRLHREGQREQRRRRRRAGRRAGRCRRLPPQPLSPAATTRRCTSRCSASAATSPCRR